MSFMSGDSPPTEKIFVYGLPETGEAGGYVLNSDMNAIRNALLEIRTALTSLTSTLTAAQTQINSLQARVAALEAAR
jgi:hypothetical protein